MKMKEAVFKYKCRRCGKIFGNICTAPENGYKFLQEVCIRGRSFSHNGFHVCLFDVHDCGVDGSGLGDLIGCEIEGEDHKE